MRSSFVSSGQSKVDPSRQGAKVSMATSVEGKAEVEQVTHSPETSSVSNSSNVAGFHGAGSLKAVLNHNSLTEIPVSTTNETSGTAYHMPTVLKGASKNMLRKKKCLDAIGQEFKLFFKFLNKRTDLDTLNEVFASYGEVIHLRIPFSQKKKKNLGYGYVIFSNAASIKAIMSSPTPVIVDGKPLVFYTFDQSRYRNEEESTSILTATDLARGPRRQDMRSLSLIASSADSIDNGQHHMSKKTGRQFEGMTQCISSKVNQEQFVKFYGHPSDPSIKPTECAYITSRSFLLTRDLDSQNCPWPDPNLRINVATHRKCAGLSLIKCNLSFRTIL